MQFLSGSLLELITQTSTNLPPDVRAAMSLTAGCQPVLRLLESNPFPTHHRATYGRIVAA